MVSSKQVHMTSFILHRLYFLQQPAVTWLLFGRQIYSFHRRFTVASQTICAVKSVYSRYFLSLRNWIRLSMRTWVLQKQKISTTCKRLLHFTAWEMPYFIAAVWYKRDTDFKTVQLLLGLPSNLSHPPVRRRWLVLHMSSFHIAVGDSVGSFDPKRGVKKTFPKPFHPDSERVGWRTRVHSAR